MPFTAPVEVPVVLVANRALPQIPNWVSLPSIAAPAAAGTAPRAATSAQVVTASTAPQSTAIAASRAVPCRRWPSMVPAVRVRQTGMISRPTISIRLATGLGFSYGCAELALKKPPPLVPSSLIASWLATGPPGRVWLPPAIVVITRSGSRFWITPQASSRTATTMLNGSSSRSTIRIRSTQKLPSSLLFRAAKPRSRAAATAIPTAAEAKFCTVSPTACAV